MIPEENTRKLLGVRDSENMSNHSMYYEDTLSWTHCGPINVKGSFSVAKD